MAAHYYVMHSCGTENITYEAMMARLENPWWVAFNAVFLVSALYHGYNGLWGIALEYLRPGIPLGTARALLLVSATALLLVGINVLAV
jgi:succinate dehydrogenase / fumarate reductase membrane anchor subunit